MATKARPPEPWYVTISDSAADKFAAMNFENALLNCRDEYVRLSVAQRAVFRADIRALVDFFERERRVGQDHHARGHAPRGRHQQQATSKVSASNVEPAGGAN